MLSEKQMDDLLLAIEREAEENKKFDKEDGVDISAPDYKPDSLIVTCLKHFESYRAVRTEEAYTSICLRTSDVSSRRKAEILNELDHKRRGAHNLALSSVNILNRLMERYGLSKLYTGPTMDDAEINKHTDKFKLKAYTDFFFDVINSVEDVSISKIAERSELSANRLSEVKRDIYKTERTWRIKEGLKDDDGTIVFDDRR